MLTADNRQPPLKQYLTFERVSGWYNRSRNLPGKLGMSFSKPKQENGHICPPSHVVTTSVVRPFLKNQINKACSKEK